MSAQHFAVWAVAAVAVAGVVLRPFRWPEAVWALGGAAILLIFGLLPWREGLAGAARASDVCLFLAGMMLLAEVARREGLFDWLAAFAVNRARGSQARLFLLVYGVGVLVTAALSNDATAVVLTPAVFAAARKAKAEPLPHLFACAFVANAASLLLPIANPANLVLYGGRTPPLGRWFEGLGPAAVTAVAVTFAVLRLVLSPALKGGCEGAVARASLGRGGRVALIGLGIAVVALMAVSALGQPLGLPTALLGAATALAAAIGGRTAPWRMLSGVSWNVLAMVVGLFVLAEAVSATGLTDQLARLLQFGLRTGLAEVAAVCGVAVATVCNLVNNLPAGLIASLVLAKAQPPPAVTDTVLIAVDLGPNLSVTGSLATMLWLAAIRREGADVSVAAFLKVGALVAPPALAAAIAARLWLG